MHKNGIAGWVGTADYKSRLLVNWQIFKQLTTKTDLQIMNALVILCALLCVATALKEDAGTLRNLQYYILDELHNNFCSYTR